MGGRKRVYTNLQELASKESVNRWLSGLAEGHSRRHGVYAMNRFVIWRSANGHEPDPERWVAECEDGTVRTLTDHLKTLFDYVKSEEFEGDKKETRRKHYFRVRGFYEANMVPLPDVRLKLPGNAANHEHQVKVQVTASSFIEMAKRVLSAGRLTVRDKAIILLQIQSGMDNSALSLLRDLIPMSSAARREIDYLLGLMLCSPRAYALSILTMWHEEATRYPPIPGAYCFWLPNEYTREKRMIQRLPSLLTHARVLSSNVYKSAKAATRLPP